VIGTLINTGAIIAGGVAGLAFGNRLGPAVQQRLKVFLAALIAYAGLSMIWTGLQNGGVITGVRQLGVALVALCLGSLVGHLCGLQRGVNRLGRWARKKFSAVKSDSSGVLRNGDPLEGFITCTLLFCVGPMAILGPLQDGLEGRWQVLGVKSLMDGLSTMGFVAVFGWGPVLAAIPVLLYQGAITLGARQLEPLLAAHDLKDALNITGGFIVTTIPLVVLDLRKVPLADYLPALPLSVGLAYWWLG